MNWPRRGVYFFFEPGEMRSGSGNGRRVVRVGTHAITGKSTSTLWGRLAQHRGTMCGSGNHRGSIFRDLVGNALARRGDVSLPPSWGVGSGRGEAARKLGTDRDAVKSAETKLEARVSDYIGTLPLLCLDVGDEPGPASERAVIERNAIALLSCYSAPAPDGASAAWLGRFSDRVRVRRSGLWNNDHVVKDYDPTFLDLLARRVDNTAPY